MTDDEIKAKQEQKTRLRQKLRELSRKIDYYYDLLSKAKENQRLYIQEHNRLDRELFEISNKITIVKEKRERKQEQKREQNVLGPQRPPYEELSTEERQVLLKRLLEIQATQEGKHTN